MEKTIRRSIVSGRVQAPPSPAVSHRAIIAASLCPGQSVISNLAFTRDVLSTISACGGMGADIAIDEGKKVADVFGLQGDFSVGEINVGECNSALKMLLPVLPALGVEAKFRGSGPLSKKPLEAYLAYLERLGATIGSEEGTLPIAVSGPLSETEIVCFPELGTQFFSGLLFSSAARSEQVAIGVDGKFEDGHYVDMTMGVLGEFGVAAERAEDDFIFSGNQSFSPANFEAPSSAYLASFLLLAGAAAGKVIVEGLGEEDSRALEGVFRSFDSSASASGEKISVSAGFPHKGEFDAPALGPYLPHALMLASLSQGECRFNNVSLLGFRSDRRLRLLLRELGKMGLKSEERDDALIVSGSRLSAATIQPEGDAVTAMVCAVAGLCAAGQTQIMGAECVDRSFPGFFTALALLGAIVH